MFKLKKLMSLGLVTILSASLLSGCGKKESDKSASEGKEKLVVWSAPLTDKDAEVWRPMLDEFEKANNCEIEFEIVPWDN